MSSTSERAWSADEEEGWVLQDIKIEGAGVVKFPGGRTKNAADVCFHLPCHEGNYSNIAEMGDMHEPAVLQLIKRRYMNDQIYTYTGDILISVNPYKTIPGIYTLPSSAEVQDRNYPPHLYAIADRSYKALTETNENQAVLISGESGAGKTEASKHIMAYLAMVSEGAGGSKPGSATKNGDAPFTRARRETVGASVERLVLQTSPVLEAFGNAKTIRNDNSSRFGKFIKIGYDHAFQISGASISHFLLERSRLVSQASRERNYHVFYQLCAGHDDPAAIHLQGAAEYNYLNQGGELTVGGVDDKDEFEELEVAMKGLGMNDELAGLYEVLAGVLLLGNLVFNELKDGKTNVVGSKVADSALAKQVASMLGVSTHFLEFALCRRTMTAGGRSSVNVILLTAPQAGENRDALAKAIYSYLFDWLVLRVNRSMADEGGHQNGAGAESNGQNAHSSIGILDIFGFEILERNTFEQLCINFANETLQQLFNHHVFLHEQQLYVDEGVDWTMLDFKDNQSVLDLIAKPGASILSTLDDQYRLGSRATDAAFLATLHSTFGKAPGTKVGGHENYETPRFEHKTTFIVKHYAGDVVYASEGFLEKNRNTIHTDLLTLVGGSKVEMLAELFAKAQADQLSRAGSRASSRGRGGAASRSRASTAKSTTSVGSIFCEQIEQLMLQLGRCSPYFIRCVKPNEEKAANFCDPLLVLNQLRYLGVIETVRIRRQGYPIRREFAEIPKLYEVLERVKLARLREKGLKASYSMDGGEAEEHGDEGAEGGDGKMSKAVAREVDPKLAATKRACEIILSRHLTRDMWQIGYRKLFLKESALTDLDAAVQNMLDNSAAKIQAMHRGRRQKLHYAKQRAAAITLTKYGRRGCAVKGFSRQRKATTAIAALARMLRCKRVYAQQQEAALKLHTVGRGMLARRCAGERRAHAATLLIQATIRGRLHRRRFAQQQQAALRIHAAGRRCVGRRRFTRAKGAAVVIQANERARAGRSRFEDKLFLCIRLQTFSRKFMASQAYAIKRHAAIKLQAWVRCRLQRRSYVRYSTSTKLQAWTRCRVQRKWYVRDRASTRLQAWARSCSGCDAFRRAQQSCVLLQSAQRRRRSQAEYTTCRLAVVAKQAWARCHLQRRWYVRNRASTKLQAWTRCRVQRKWYVRDHASTRLQANARKRSAMAQLNTCLAAAIVIQTVQRKFAAMARYRIVLLATLQLQTWRRMHGTLPSLHHPPPSKKSPRRPSKASAWAMLQVRICHSACTLLLVCVIFLPLSQPPFSRTPSFTFNPSRLHPLFSTTT
jgi:myosin-5